MVSDAPSRPLLPPLRQSGDAWLPVLDEQVAAALRQAFIQPDRAQASQMLRHVAGQLRDKFPKLAAFIDASEADVLSYMDFAAQHRTKIHSTNPIERLNKEVKRGADVVGAPHPLRPMAGLLRVPNEASTIRLIGAALLEQNDEWQLQHRYMQVEAMADITAQPIDADKSTLPTLAA